MEIASTGNLSLMSKLGIEDEGCEIAWGEVLKENSTTNSDLNYIHMMNDYKALGGLTRDFIMVRANLLKLSFIVDDEALDFLKRKGYSINLSSALAYSESLTAGIKRSEHLNTRIEMKRNEIVRKYKRETAKPITFEEAIAELNVSLGFVVERDITLASFNEYRKILKNRKVA